MRPTIAIAALLALAGVTMAQQTVPAPKPEQPAAQPPAEKPAQPPAPAPQPTLDDLLGITPSKKPAPSEPAPPAPDPGKAALDRKLSNQEISQAFLQAVRLMDETAARLEQSKDTSITTQRMQEDVIRKLDILIAQAKKQQQQSQSQSSKPQDQDPGQQNQQQNQQQQGQNNEQKNNSNTSENDPPSRRDGQLGPEMAHGAAWGALPARVRDALLQGNADKYSSMYQKWTEAYYRKIAEEAGK